MGVPMDANGHVTSASLNASGDATNVSEASVDASTCMCDVSLNVAGLEVVPVKQVRWQSFP